MNDSFKKLWKEYRYFLVFVFLMLVFRSAVADWNDVPTASMNPTIIEGDRIFVNKAAYDVRLPFSQISLHRISDPSTGDIIVFDSKAANKRLVKRVIGVPGDTVKMVDNRLIINGEKVRYEALSLDSEKRVHLERLAEREYQIQLLEVPSIRSSMGLVLVPEDHYLVLGDNRDNSSDSRFIGFVPRHEIRGRGERVVFSLDYDNYFLPRAGRFWQVL